MLPTPHVLICSLNIQVYGPVLWILSPSFLQVNPFFVPHRGWNLLRQFPSKKGTEFILDTKKIPRGLKLFK